MQSSSSRIYRKKVNLEYSRTGVPMIPVNVEFEVDYNGKPIHIKSKDTAKGVIYVATYPGAKDLYIHRATNAIGDHFWTSIPEGRQPAAERIGHMIEAYFHDHEND